MHLLFRNPYGLGDAVQLTCVLQHLAKHPADRTLLNCPIDPGAAVVESRRGQIDCVFEVPGASTAAWLATRSPGADPSVTAMGAN